MAPLVVMQMLAVAQTVTHQQPMAAQSLARPIPMGSTAVEEIVIAELQASSLEEARRIPETFFRHFRRPEIYESWKDRS